MRLCKKTIRKRSHFAKGSFRWTRKRETEDGSSRALIGCPKGEWDARAEQCRVGTQAYEVFLFTNKKRCPRGYKTKR